MNRLLTAKKVWHYFVMLFLVAGCLLFMNSIAYAVSANQYYYHVFQDAFFFEVPIVDGKGMSLAEFLEVESDSDALIFSDFDQKYYVLSRGTAAGYKGPTSQYVKAGEAYFPGEELSIGRVSDTIVGLTCSPTNMPLSALHFEEDGGKVYIYFRFSNSKQYSARHYLNIKEDGTLELHVSDKTAWTVEQQSRGNRYLRFLDSGNRYYLAITDQGLTIVAKDSAPHDGYLYVHAYHAAATDSYLCYHTGEDYIYEPYSENRRNTDLNDAEVLGWSEKSTIGPKWYYGSTNFLPSLISSLKGMKNECIHLYPIYGGTLHFTIVNTDGETVKTVSSTYCPPVGDDQHNFSDGLRMAENCWATFDMPTVNKAGGKILTVSEAYFCTDNRYAEKNDAIDTGKYSLSILNEGQTLLVSSIPINTDVYLKIIVKEEAAEVVYNGDATAYVENGFNPDIPSKKSLTANGTSFIKMKCTPPVIIPDFGNEDTANYDYDVYWYLDDGDETSLIASGSYHNCIGEDNILYGRLPDVMFDTDAKVWAVIKRTNTETGKFAMIESDHLSISIKKFHAELIDVDTSSALTSDKLFVTAPKNSQCWVSVNGGMKQKLDSSNSFEPDGQTGGTTLTFQTYGFCYKVTENGTYIFEVRDGSSEFCATQSMTVTYRNIRPSYTVKFDMNGHGEGIAAQTIMSGTVVTEPEKPSEEGWDFGGWYIDAGCEYAWDFDENTVNSELTLYAGWTEHICSNPTSVSGEMASCTEDGYKDCYQCSCGRYYEDADCVTLIDDYAIWKNGAGKLPAGHTYGEPVYTWNNAECTAVRICSVCTESTTGHSETETVTGTYVKDSDATCIEAEKGHYSAAFTNTAFTAQQTTENTAINGHPLGHDFNGEYKNNGDGTHSRKCTCCDEYGEAVQHSYKDFVCVCGDEDLTSVKEQAIAEIGAAMTDANTDCAEDAIAAIKNAVSVDEVNTLKEQALDDMAAADEENLAKTKEAAKEAILAEQGDDTSESVVKATEDAIAAIVTATNIDEVNVAKQAGIEAIRDAKAGNVPLPPVQYIMLNGTDSSWTKGGTTGLLFRSDAPFAKFDSVQVDGDTIASTNYIAEEGSTKITLTPAYLGTLSIGRHSIKIVSIDGSVSTFFTVKLPTLPATHTVSFVMGGHGTAPADQRIINGNTASKPADPTAEGWVFSGWYVDARFSTKFNFNAAITSNTKVYAKWTKDATDPTDPIDPIDPVDPKTGDDSHAFPWIILLLVSGGALIGTMVYDKKSKYHVM